MNTLKPGYKTSEFAATLAVMIVTLLILAGLVEPAEREGLTAALADLLTALAAVASTAHVVARYVEGRTALKVRALEEGRG